MQEITSAAGQVYEVHTWFERDRAAVELRHRDTQETAFELRDEDVGQAFEDGYLKGGERIGREQLGTSLMAYAVELGALAEFERKHGFDREHGSAGERSL